MSFFTQARTFPAIILPAFIGAAFLLAVLLRHRNAATPWRYRDLVAAGCVALAFCFAVLPLVSRNYAGVTVEVDNATPSFEADMLVSRGNGVDLWLNDWQHPAERVPVVAGERHVYRFTRLPRNISLIRFDPTDMADSRIAIYSLTVRVGSRVLRQFGPAELKTWTLHEVSPPKERAQEQAKEPAKEEAGALVLQSTTDDPILWTPLTNAIPLPEVKPRPQPSWLERNYRPVAGISSLLLLVLAYLATSVRLAPQWSRPCPQLPSRYRNILLSPWFTTLVVLLVAGGTLYLQNHAAATDVWIEVDMLVSRGGGVDLWLNDWEHPAERLPVVRGQRHVYRFLNIPREISLLRLDPTDMPDTRVVIYSVDFRGRNQIFQHFGPGDLKTWGRVNLSEPTDEDGGVAMTDINDDPILITPLRLQLPGGRLQALSPFIESVDGPFLLAIATFLLLLLVRMTTHSGRMQALLTAAGSLVAYPVVRYVIKLDLLPPPPVTSAVGYASYHGYDKANEYLSALCVMLLCVLLGYVFARLAGSRAHQKYQDIDDEAGETFAASPGAFIWIAQAGVLGLLLLYFTPDLTVTLKALGGMTYQYHGWDDAVGTHWLGMINSGLLPIRDFWFPYSGGFIQLLPYPWGTLSSNFHWALVLGVLYVGLLRATGRRIAHALVLFALILMPVLLAMLPGSNRYLVSIDIALLYVAIYDRQRWDWKVHLPFAVFVGYAFFYEPTQVIYASVGIAADTVLTMLSLSLTAVGRRSQESRKAEAGMPQPNSGSLRERLVECAQVLKQRLLYVAVPMLAGIACALLVYGASGMLPGLLDFERSIGDQGNYGALPSEISQWMQPALRPESMFLLLFLLAGYAVYRWVRSEGRRDPLGKVLIVLCSLSYLAIQKQVLRPHVMTQIRLFPYVAVLIFGLIVWREHKPAVRMVVMAFLGCMLGIAVHRNLWFAFFLQDAETGPKRISGTVDTVLHHLADFRQANTTLYSRTRFVGFDKENAVVDTLTRECGLRAEDNLYVLGDYPIFYMLLNQRPPYVSNSYNSSPIYEQQKVLDWFHRAHPRFVVWGTDALAYDEVPHMVRLPLIYTYVVEHYRFVRAVGSYQILEVLPPEQKPDLKYWRQILGDGVDLGAIPGLARDSEYMACAGDKTQCDAVLTVKYPEHMAVPRGKLAVSIGPVGVGLNPADRFHIDFNVTPGKREYVINLNRLWFWKSLAKPAEISAEGPVQTRVEYERERRPVLY